MTIQKSPFLRLQRNFPNDNIQKLTVEIDKFHVDAAIKVNEREIATYALNNAIVNGQRWFLTGQPNQQGALRKLFSFTATTSIAHGLTWSTVSLISPLSCGSYTDGTNWYGLPFGTSTAIAGQITFYVTSTQIVFSVGAGAPALSQGYIDLEWVSTV